MEIDKFHLSWRAWKISELENNFEQQNFMAKKKRSLTKVVITICNYRKETWTKINAILLKNYNRTHPLFKVDHDFLEDTIDHIAPKSEEICVKKDVFTNQSATMMRLPRYFFNKSKFLWLWSLKIWEEFLLQVYLNGELSSKVHHRSLKGLFHVKEQSSRPAWASAEFNLEHIPRNCTWLSIQRKFNFRHRKTIPMRFI